jgi:hypothetical protein
MKTSALREIDYFLAWFLFFICATIGGAIVGAVGGGIIGAILGVSGASPESLRVAGGVVGFVLALPVSYLFFRFMVWKFVVQKLIAQSEVPPLPIDQHGSSAS